MSAEGEGRRAFTHWETFILPPRIASFIFPSKRCCRVCHRDTVITCLLFEGTMCVKMWEISFGEYEESFRSIPRRQNCPHLSFLQWRVNHNPYRPRPREHCPVHDCNHNSRNDYGTSFANSPPPPSSLALLYSFLNLSPHEHPTWCS